METFSIRSPSTLQQKIDDGHYTTTFDHIQNTLHYPITTQKSTV